MNLLLRVKQRDFVQCMVDVLSVAVTHNLPESAEDVLGCLRQLRPKLEHLDFFEGWIAVLRNDFATAMRVARSVSERTGDWPYASVLLAYCQFATGDRTWAVAAERVLRADGCDDAKQLMMMLLGRIDPREIGADEGLMAAIGGLHEQRIESNFVRA